MEAEILKTFKKKQEGGADRSPSLPTRVSKGKSERKRLQEVAPANILEIPVPEVMVQPLPPICRAPGGARREDFPDHGVSFIAKPSGSASLSFFQHIMSEKDLALVTSTKYKTIT
ncbi:hypothetical protein F511_17832 [Dorcoceras hygrometricum]|uniref:Uncharacterized protein n=1 Tax=Dorcoceras hygrometricum TaxID=472368 RepID=A0A2Z7AIH9_9LAMI|nr:hypothetical protein F511_17832 [Dorcoceras hygrometricum]